MIIERDTFTAIVQGDDDYTIDMNELEYAINDLFSSRPEPDVLRSARNALEAIHEHVLKAVATP